MTTIAYRDGVMAADSRAYSGSSTPIGSKTKIRRLDDGTLVGCSTTIPGLGEVILDWYTKGADLEKAPKLEDKHRFSLLVVKPGGLAFIADDSFYLSGPIRADFYSVGSGCEYALGAMKMHATAEQAVAVATAFDVWSMPPIFTISHDIC